MLIRPERVSDYATIGALHARAFGNRSAEAIIVPLLRQRRTFDPKLSLVAEINGRVVGHALFSPYQMRLLGQTIPTVNLAPIAVNPTYQGQGIGGQLIIEGHTIAAAKGYSVSILLGHTSYYPRFGYHTHAFGPAQVVVPTNALSEDTPDILDTHDPTNEDIPLLNDLWIHEEGSVDMALEPGHDLLDWLSPDPAIHATVYTRNSDVVGYTRIHRAEPTRPRVFLARDNEAARAMVVTIARRSSSDTSETEYILPLHPFSASTEAFGHATYEARAAAMACSLGPAPLDDYLARVQTKQRPPGRIIWPVAFDLG